MNPTDQARKEARKRELKKNKKQRMMVRAAVLKMKDPKQIIRDMEKLDEMEFNPVQQPQLNEKVLKDKRKKLRETFERILRLYEKENPDIYKELRKLEVEYEQKRAQLSQYFDAVKNAQHVEVESIPLPDMPHAPSNILIQDIPLPGAQPPSILKKTSAYGPPTRAVSILPLLGHGVPRLPPGRKPPGPPPGPPPPQVLQMYGRKVGFALDLPLVDEMKTCYTVLNLLNGVMMMMFPAPVKMMAILKTWIKISMTTVLMTVTLTDQMEKVKGMNLCTVMILREKTMKKKVRSECTICRYAWKIKEEEEEHEGADSSSSHDASNGRSGNS